ncbi:Mitochondria-eating protein [Lamellibrachia satsuma]|nr:Mitochondria-eating protein [Lamellibrachia satsuma]
MAESLRRLVNIGSFSILQEKLEKWLDDYHVNTCDQNVARCCEVIELNARIQSQLFKLLSLSAAEGGAYGGAGIIKDRLLPWLGQGLVTVGGLSTDTSLNILADVAAKDRELGEVQDMYERSIQNLQADLTQTRLEADDLKKELDDTREELDSSKRMSTSEKMFSEAEVRDQRSKIIRLEDEIIQLRSRANLVDTYEHQLRKLRDDISMLTGRDYLINGEIFDSVKSYHSLPRPSSPFALDDVTQRVRQQTLITRFNDMFASDRLDAMDTLRQYSDDHENNQRIIFVAMQDAFTVAKLAFANFKVKVRSNVAATHLGPETLEEAVQDYVNRNSDLYDLPGMVADVIRYLNRNPKIFLPPEISYSVIQPFVREACKMAWGMSALARPLDIAVSADGELFEDSKYRRSYDSEFSAPLVNHHIWPCLVQGIRVLMKGECCSRRGATLQGRPGPAADLRALDVSSRPTVADPVLVVSDFTETCFSRHTDGCGFRTRSRTSSSPSRAVTASTSLSHYGIRC